MLEFFFVFILALATLLLIYPYFLYPLILRVIPTITISRNANNEASVTILFCAYNEGAVIEEKLHNIESLKRRHPDLEVFAFDDGSSDDTFQKLSARPDLLQVVRGSGRSGKAHGMKLISAKASGEILVFTDANVILDENAIDNLKSWYSDQTVGGVCGALKYLDDKQSATASVGGRYWRLEERIKSEESRSGNVMGADGSIFSIRRSLYPSFPDTVLDDMTVSMSVVFALYRLIKVDDVIAYERLVAASSEEFRRKIRIATRAFHTHLYLLPQLMKMGHLDKFKYVSHKLIRWFGGAFLLASIISFIGLGASVSLHTGLAAVFSVGLALGLLVAFKEGPIGTLREIIIAMMATLIGVVSAIRGEVLVTWAPAKTR